MSDKAHNDDDDGRSSLIIGVLALQGAFEEHEKCLHAIGCCQTRQIRTVQDLLVLQLDDSGNNSTGSGTIDGIILPGGESTAMGLIGTTTTTTTGTSDGTTTTKNMWEALQEFHPPIWGTCAGMILLAEQCIGTSAVIQDGQALIGGMNICVARNYFGSQVSSFEMPIPGPPIATTTNDTAVNDRNNTLPFPGVFIRAPAILSAGSEVQVLGTVVATPCRQAAITLHELDRKIAAGENVIKLGVMDALERKEQGTDLLGSITGVGGGGGTLRYKSTAASSSNHHAPSTDDTTTTITTTTAVRKIELPGAADDTNARTVICAARKGNLLCTAFHPELTNDYRWHEYFVQMVLECKNNNRTNTSNTNVISF